MTRDDEQARRSAETVTRRSYGKLIAFLAARTGDVAGAEDALSDAFVTALADWPRSGIPVNPEAWLMAVERRKLIDGARRARTGMQAVDQLRLVAAELEDIAAANKTIPDDRLALMFACAHPDIDAAVRAPLILQTILGFDAAAIASSFLISPAAMSQRLVRAKSKICDAGVPFRVPDGGELRERLDAAFSEGWADPAGTETRRRDLAEEGIWLGRLLVSLLPNEPEAIGLLALMLYAEARRGARRDAQGAYVPLADQDPTRWDAQLLHEAEALLQRASVRGPTGRYQLEAAVQSAHVIRRLTGRSDWHAIERIYDTLLAMTGSPVVAINRAIAIAETRGARAGLAELDRWSGDARLADYQPYWAARAGLLARAGDIEAARHAFDIATGLESDPAVRGFLQQRRAELAS